MYVLIWNFWGIGVIAVAYIVLPIEIKGRNHRVASNRKTTVSRPSIDEY
jgi:hypothetical protein